MGIVDEKIESYIFPDMVLYDKYFYYINNLMKMNRREDDKLIADQIVSINNTFNRLTKRDIGSIPENKISDLAFGSMMRDSKQPLLAYDINKIDVSIPVLKLASAFLIFNEELYTVGNMSKNLVFVPEDVLDEKLLRLMTDQDIQYIKFDAFIKNFENILETGEFIEVVSADINLIQVLYLIMERYRKNNKIVKLQVNFVLPDILMCAKLSDDDARKYRDSNIHISFYNF